MYLQNFQQITLKVQISFNDNFAPASKGLYDTFIKLKALT